VKPRALILFVPGTNRDGDVAAALELAGAVPEVFPVRHLYKSRRNWSDFQMLVVPGGFSYADALGAGRLLALDLTSYFAEQVESFLAQGKPVIGICNGFQALVKAGILPDVNGRKENPQATLTFNQSNHFECRWVTLKPVSKKCIWTAGLTQPVRCPVAHGEGNFQVSDTSIIRQLQDDDQIALIYIHPDGSPAGGEYPHNPNGSAMDIAGLCNPEGNVLGLMPHPENHVFPFQSPDRKSCETYSGLPLFINGVNFASQF
jgi:phosphoribosylformylglycinamidine synthase I